MYLISFLILFGNQPNIKHVEKPCGLGAGFTQSKTTITILVDFSDIFDEKIGLKYY